MITREFFEKRSVSQRVMISDPYHKHYRHIGYLQFWDGCTKEPDCVGMYMQNEVLWLRPDQVVPVSEHGLIADDSIVVDLVDVVDAVGTRLEEVKREH